MSTFSNVINCLLNLRVEFPALSYDSDDGFVSKFHSPVFSGHLIDGLTGGNVSIEFQEGSDTVRRVEHCSLHVWSVIIKVTR